jgi:hypothetical protein
MTSYVEQPYRVKSSRLLFSRPFLKAQSSRGANAVNKKSDEDDDPVKAMQNRMLHTALHNRGTFNPSLHNNSKTTRSESQFSNVKPPRGTLCDEKLPYLDWRLGLLELQQLQIEERAEKLSRKSISYSADMDRTNDKAVVMRQQRSTVSTSTGSDLGSDPSSSQGLDTLDYFSHDNSWHSSTAKHTDQTTQYHDDLYANAILHQTLITNGALAVVPPLIHDESHLTSTGSGNGDDCGDDNSNNEKDLYYEAEDSTDRPAPIPAPLRPEPLYQPASIGPHNASMEKTSSLRLPRLFSRAARRPPPVARSQSQGCVPTLTRNEATTNDSALQEKPKKKWTLLALHNLGGSEAMIRETNMLR